MCFHLLLYFPLRKFPLSFLTLKKAGVSAAGHGPAGLIYEGSATAGSETILLGLASGTDALIHQKLFRLFDKHCAVKAA